MEAMAKVLMMADAWNESQGSGSEGDDCTLEVVFASSLYWRAVFMMALEQEQLVAVTFAASGLSL
jgi:hypothetical protein